MNKEEFLSNPLLKNISAQKKELLSELAEQAGGTPIEKMLPVLVKTNARMKALGLSFTKEETALIMQVITKNITPEERKKFEVMQHMMNKKT